LLSVVSARLFARPVPMIKKMKPQSRGDSGIGFQPVIGPPTGAGSILPRFWQFGYFLYVGYFFVRGQANERGAYFGIFP
jgi:hypothetical protein